MLIFSYHHSREPHVAPFSSGQAHVTPFIASQNRGFPASLDGVKEDTLRVTLTSDKTPDNPDKPKNRPFSRNSTVPKLTDNHDCHFAVSQLRDARQLRCSLNTVITTLDDPALGDLGFVRGYDKESIINLLRDMLPPSDEAVAAWASERGDVA